MLLLLVVLYATTTAIYPFAMAYAYKDSFETVSAIFFVCTFFGHLLPCITCSNVPAEALFMGIGTLARSLLVLMFLMSSTKHVATLYGFVAVFALSFGFFSNFMVYSITRGSKCKSLAMVASICAISLGTCLGASVFKLSFFRSFSL